MITPLPQALLAAIAEQTDRSVPTELHSLAEQVRQRFGNACVAILFYGSCLRSGNPADGLVDLYALINDYGQVHHNPCMRLANACLPPNVYLLQARTTSQQTLQAKCALLTLSDFEQGTAHWFQSYLWGRFAQPSRLVYSQNPQVTQRIHQAIAQASLRLMRQTLPCLPERFTVEQLWQRAFSLSYATELRPEAANRPRQLVEFDYAYYQRVFFSAQPALDNIEYSASKTGEYRNLSSLSDCTKGRRQWKLRRIQGRILNVLRLIKSVFTFENAVDYVAWKVERHTGQALPITPRLRRYPLIFCWPVLWRLLKERRLR